MTPTKLSNRYEIAGELGRGGMGVVYRAKDPVLNREVAVKLISSQDLAPEIEGRFQREAQIVAQMDHPAIVPIYDFGSDDGSLFFVMPLVGGTTLLRMVREQSLRLGDVLDIGIQVADALEYSHARGVVHRDIKPANIMVTREEEGASVRVRVMDFGLARADSESRLTKTGTLIGTMAYLSPEQVSSRAFDARSDIYALGVVLYECLVGDPPFTGEVQSILYRIVHENPQPPRALGSEIREELQDIVMRCLEKDPGKRPQKAGQVAEVLRRHKAGLATDESRMSIVASPSRMIQRPSLSAFVGREKEFAELQRRLNAAISGDCQFAMVAGEPGIGKTRLLEELKNLATARKIRVLYGRFVEQGGAFSYQGFSELIQDYFRSRDPTASSGSSAADRPDFSDLAADLIALFPQLSEIADLRSSASGQSRATAVPSEEKKPEDRMQVFELLARTLTRIGGGKPLVLILENLHGAEVSIEALQYVVRRLGPTPTLVVGSYRQTETDKRHPVVRMHDSFADDPRFVTMTLAPFSSSEHRALVASIVGAPKVSDSLARRLHDATEGNPFFTKELVRSLVDAGNISRDDTGGWSFSTDADISADVLPATIQQAVERRIERLSEDLRDALSIASVLGKTFDARDLETLMEAGASRNLDDDLDRLLRDGIIEEERESRGDRLTFASGIVRDVLYAALSRRKRRSLHRKYAELIEKRSAGRLERVYPELVHHFSQADVPDKTVDYGLKLAQKSLDAFSSEETIRVTKIVLEYLEDEEWTGDPSLEGKARLLLAQGHRMSGNVDAALRETEAAVKTLGGQKDSGPAAGAMLFAAETAWHARRVDDARRWIDRGLAAAAVDKEPERRAKLLALAAAVANMRGEYRQAAAYQTELEALAPKGKTAVEDVAAGGSLVVAMSNPIASLEPGTYATTEEHEVLANVFETLVTTDTQGNLAPLLCDRWSVADDARTVRLHLRAGIVFSDGAPMTASAVKTSLERSMQLSRDAIPAAFAAIAGGAEFLDGKTSGIEGIVIPSELEVEIGLKEPLPIFPSLLTDGRTSIVREVPREGAGGGPARVLGTGPFRTVAHTPDRALLERNPRFWRMPPRLDSIEFKATLPAAAIGEGLRSGAIDLARDLLPKDLEAVLREPRFRGGLVETPKKNTYFALFNSRTPAGSNAALRTALASASRAQDIVWGALGRFALPATGLLPPGILGHDPGRRHPHVPREKAAEMIRSTGLPLPLKLKAAVHPTLQNQYAGLTRALFQIWAELGVEVEIATKTMAEFIEAWQEARNLDLWIGRWIADYDDPDNFTFTLLNSRNGRLRSYFSSPEADAILDEARAESRPAARESLYRKFEFLLADAAALVPLFHDVDYRIGSASLRGLALHSSAPYVNYSEVGKTEAPVEAEAAGRQDGGGILQVPVAGIVRSLEPSVTGTLEQVEVFHQIFETLTFAVDGTRIVPWLASSFSIENEGTRFRFKLRPGVRFHDGRRMTARDVRYSFERLLANPQSDYRWQLSVIRGARRVLDGAATDLEGFHIVSPMELYIDLEQPVAFFPALVSYLGTGIVPEGTATVGSSWRDHAVGTGPFRVVGFEPGRRLELERNPHYWRDGYPRCEGLVFRFGASSEEVREDFEAGRLSVAQDLLPADVERLRHDPQFASGYREGPKLQTYFVAFNGHRGPMRDADLRRSLVEAVDVPGLVRRTLGRLGIPAHGLIPPGLLGHSSHRKDSPGSSPGVSSDTSIQATISRETIELTVALHPIFFGELSAFFRELAETFREMGYVLKPVNKTMAEYLDINRKGEPDLAIGRWGADYPDADTFVYGVLHSTAGILGRYIGNAEIDRLTDEGRAETDPRTRHSLYRRVEELVARDALLLPLFHDQVYGFVRPEVEGFERVGQASPTIYYEELRLRR